MTWWTKLVDKARGVYGAAPPPPGQGGCDHGAIHLRQGTAEFEWFVARGELEMKRDLKHGASHLANLLSYDPGYPEWVELLEQYLAAAGPDPEKLIPRGDKLYFSTEAMRAYVWHKQGRLEDAVRLLTDVTRAKADARYLEAWALDWLEPPGAVEFLPRPLGLQLFMTALNRFPEVSHSPLARLREVRRWAGLCERFADKFPAGPEATMLRAGLFRKAGLFDRAEAVVRPVLSRAPTWHAATALGLILRQKGDVDGAEAAFKHALKLDPSDVAARLEAGDTFYERQLWQQALGWYENALKKEKNQPWAAASALFCRWKLTGDERPLRDLVALAKKQNQRARELVHQAYWARLPEPTDATANVVRQMREESLANPSGEPVRMLSMSVTHLEAPSNYLAMRLEVESWGQAYEMDVSAGEVPEPDPRRPMAEVKYLLWKYDGTVASPAPPAPGDDVVRMIAALAETPYDPSVNWAAASHVVEQLGPARIDEVLAVMVHPPPVPKGLSALEWLPRVQLTAAQVAGQVDEGWDGSARREALLSVLHGPSDWATEAAIRVLAVIGRDNEAFAPDIHDAFQVLADHRPNSGHCPWEETLFSSWLDLPHLYPKEREELQRTLKGIQDRGRDDD